jgi:sulfur carrier protein ThiS
VAPTATEVATPLLLMLAAAGFDEVQIARCVTSCVDPSEKAAVAVNGSVVPSGRVIVDALIVTEVRVAAVTLRGTALMLKPW